MAAEYDYYERYGGDAAVQMSAYCDSDEYAMRRRGSHAVLAEAPCFTRDQVAGLLGPAAASPWRRAVEGYLRDAARDLPAEKAQARSAPGFSAEATVAQRFDSLYNRELLALCRSGQFAGMLDAGAAGDPRLAALRDAAETRVGERVADVTAAAGIRPVPVRARVQMQLGALLASLAHARERRPPRPR